MSHRDRKKRQVRRQWIQAGKACFAREGFEGSSVARIAAEAGLSRPGFFLYFASKKELRTAIRLDCLQALTVMASQEAAREGPPQERVQRALERMAHWMQLEAHTVQGCGLLASGLVPEEKAEAQAWERLSRQLLGAAEAADQPAAAVWVSGVLRSAWQQSPIDIEKTGALIFAVLGEVSH